MNFNHLLLSSVPQNDKLLEYGFIQREDSLRLTKKLTDEFYVTVSYDSKNLTAEVYENGTDEKYTLIDVKTAQGAFVNDIRTKIKELLDDISAKCFYSTDLKSQYVAFLENSLNTKGDYPWEGEDTYAVYRCKNQKWFALVAQIKFKNLGLDSEEPVWVVNLKADADKIPELVDKKSIFPAWHMNKKYWITIVLTAITDFYRLKELTIRSKELVEKK